MRIFHPFNGKPDVMPDGSGLASGVSVSCTVISESGLYKLIIQSKEPIAKQFRNWLIKGVLPAIRKDSSLAPEEKGVISTYTLPRSRAADKCRLRKRSLQAGRAE
jgi:prophage antirepressor-like protein